MGLANKYLPEYTVEDYRKWEGDWELIEGIPFAMSPSPVAVHQRLLFQVGRLLAQQIDTCEKKCFIYPELDWILSEDTVLRPDISVLCREIKDYIKEPPDIIVEIVSKSTAKKDEYLKFEIYQREKVKYYILVYPDIQKIKAFHLKKDRYDKIFDGDTGILELNLNNCKINLPVENIFA